MKSDTYTLVVYFNDHKIGRTWDADLNVLDQYRFSRCAVSMKCVCSSVTLSVIISISRNDTMNFH